MPPARRCVELRFGHGGPDIVKALKISVAMVDTIVHHIPQAAGMEAWNKDRSRDPFVPNASRHESTVSGVVSDQEEKANQRAVCDTKKDVDPDRERCDRSRHRGEIEREMDAKQPKSRAERLTCNLLTFLGSQPILLER